MQIATKATRIAALAALIAGLGASAAVQAQSLPSTGMRAVPTYEAVGLYWTAPGASAAGCDVRYRKAGATTWSSGLNLWYDAFTNECRGSLVSLTPGTNYEAQVGVAGNFSRGIGFTTWSNITPVAKTVKVAAGSSQLNVTEGGSAGGYVVYDGAGATLDAGNGAANNILVSASYVVLRNFNLRGARENAIMLSPNVHDVVIEDNDISGWGRTRDGKWGADLDSAVRAICSSETLTRVTIQRNRIHDPRYPANSWADGHPMGPQAVSFSYCGGNHVFRWNEIYSTNGNRFNDAFGGEDNFTTTGFPNSDSDIYGNKISHAWDDAIEAEGANKNVRIWGNYIDRTAIGIATTLTSVGPVYIFRNVFNRSQFYQGKSSDSDSHEVFLKSGSDPDFRNGRRYVFHNTMLQAMDAGQVNGGGGGAGMGGTGDSQPVRNTVSMNNVYHLWKTGTVTYQVGSDNQFQNDMFNGAMGAAVSGGLNAVPKYAAGNGWQSEAGGLYALAAGTPGHDGGIRIPNFNDGFQGGAPDVGAAEAGAGAMKFGIAASTGSSGGTATPPPSVPPSLPPAPPPALPPAPPGTLPTSFGIDSSAYTSNSGQAVTFTAKIPGTGGTARFQYDGNVIGNCSAVPVVNGIANCATSALPAGSWAVRAFYSGAGSFGAGTAGPITQTVKAGSTGGTAPVASVNVHGLWWGSQSESGWGLNLAQQGDIIFATWFTYDSNGRGQWLVMSKGQRIGTNSFAGALHRTTGPGYNEASFDPKRIGVTQVGTATLTFSDAMNGVFTATVDGVPVTKAITRQVFGALPTCTAGGPQGASVNYQDLWWRSSGTESGWGMNITHQGNTMFVTWFTYDSDGRGMWLVGSNVNRNADGSFTGTLYRTTGPAFNTVAWNPAAVGTTAVGSIRLVFSDANNGVMSATVNGIPMAKPISRQAFSSPATVCR